MAHIYLATLGQRPEAITIALDMLMERYDFAEVVTLHTEPRLSGIADAYTTLKAVLARDYPHLRCQWCELVGHDGSPLLDIDSQTTANHYYRAVLDVLLEYKRQGDTLHLLVSGGRKAMSIYATVAAAAIFGSQDRVWTLLSPPALVEVAGQFHIPAGMRHQVQLVQSPLQPAHVIANGVALDVEGYLSRRQNLRTDFFSRLSKAEQEVAEVFTQHPYDINEDIAQLLGKSKRTIDNQFASMYLKLTVFLDFGDHTVDKRAILRDLLLERY